MTFKSGWETFWQISGAEESGEVTAAGLEASDSCLRRSQLLTKTERFQGLGFHFWLGGGGGVGRGRGSSHSAPFLPLLHPLPFLFLWVIWWWQPPAWYRWWSCLPSVDSPTPWSLGKLKSSFLTACPELWRPLFCSAESSSLFTSMMFPLYPPPYIWTLEYKLGFVYSSDRWLDSDLRGT